MEENKVHYICAGECGAVSDKPGVCQAESCSMHGQNFHECHCEDGMHRAEIPGDPAAASA